MAVLLPLAVVAVGCSDEDGRGYRRSQVMEAPPPEVLSSYEADLTPYGQWVDLPGDGHSWVPANRPQNWQPYTVGHWVYTDDGWSWESDGDETNWGYLTYHYGRWDSDSKYGWVWVPGATYAPAWVTWREGGGYVGWAPLPPRVDTYDASPADFDRTIPDNRYVYLDEGLIASPDVSNDLVSGGASVVGQTRNITRITRANNRVVNGGVPLAEAERVTGQRIVAVQPTRVTTAAEVRQLRAQGKTVAFVPATVQRAEQQTQVTAAPLLRVNATPNRTTEVPVDQKLQQPRAEQQLQQQKLDARRDAEQRAAGRQQAAEQRGEVATPRPAFSPAALPQRDPAIQHQPEAPVRQPAQREQAREPQGQQRVQAQPRAQAQPQFRDRQSAEPDRGPIEPSAQRPSEVRQEPTATPAQRPAGNPAERPAGNPSERPEAHKGERPAENRAAREPAPREAPQRPAERPQPREPAPHEQVHQQPHHEAEAPHAAESSKQAPERREGK